MGNGGTMIDDGVTEAYDALLLDGVYVHALCAVFLCEYSNYF